MANDVVAADRLADPLSREFFEGDLGILPVCPGVVPADPCGYGSLLRWLEAGTR